MGLQSLLSMRRIEARRKKASAFPSRFSQSLGRKGGETRDIAESLDKWFAHVANGSRLILLWTGHGCSDGGWHYLICRSSPRDGVSSFNAVEVGAIGEIIANCKAEKILIILDTCHSGQGAGQIASVLEGILAARVSPPGQERVFAIIASAHPLEIAQEAVAG